MGYFAGIGNKQYFVEDGKVFLNKDKAQEAPADVYEELNKESEPTVNIEEIGIAKKLLQGEGLNHSSFMRVLDLDTTNRKLRDQIKPVYEKVLKYFEGNIHQQGHDWFWNKE